MKTKKEIDELKKFVSELPLCTMRELKILVYSLLKTDSLYKVDLFNILNKPISYFNFEKNGISEEVALALLERIKYIVKDVFAVENGKICITNDFVRILRLLEDILNKKNINKKKEDTLLKEGNNSDFSVSFSKIGEVVLNDKYRLSKPNFNSENYNFIDFVCSHPNSKITRDNLRHFKYEVDKNFRQIISDLGFKGELKKLFFPNISQDAVEFRNNITQEKASEYRVNFKKLNNLIKKLKEIT